MNNRRSCEFKKWRNKSSVAAAGLLGALLLAPGATAEEWPPITPEELALKDDPMRPGAPAIILFRTTSSDFKKFEETNHFRIKILTEAGKKYADIELPYWRKFVKLEDLEARTVRPDGRVVPFTGQVYEKTLAKTRKMQILAKTLTLPEVEVGSIVEWRYRLRWKGNWWYFTPPWRIQGELSLLKGSFFVKPGGGPGLRLVRLPHNLPSGLVWEGDREVLDIRDVPGLAPEEHAPPWEWQVMWVKFYYRSRYYGLTEMAQEVEKFIGKPREVESALARIISPGDSPEVKLRKLYERTNPRQRVGGRTEQERERAKLKENKSVKEVLQRRYGTFRDWNRVFVALARAAGLQASVVQVAGRDGELYDPLNEDFSLLGEELALVRLGDKDLYLSPGVPLTPFGLLPWEQTAARGVKFGQDRLAHVHTPQPQSGEAVTRRTGTLRLDSEGSLEGTVEVSFRGQEALERRQEAYEEDEIEVRKELEEELKGQLPAEASVTLEEVGPWETSEEPLKARFNIKLPAFAPGTGRRLLVPLGIFQAQRQHPFEHQQRTQPVYFQYPWEEEDEITVELPEGYSVEGLPDGTVTEVRFGRYEIGVKQEENRLRIKRRLVMERYYFPAQHYAALRDFYSRVTVGDGQHAILQAAMVAQESE